MHRAHAQDEKARGDGSERTRSCLQRKMGRAIEAGFRRSRVEQLGPPQTAGRKSEHSRQKFNPAQNSSATSGLRGARVPESLRVRNARLRTDTAEAGPASASSPAQTSPAASSQFAANVER